MATLSRPQPWLEFWKRQAQAERDWLARVLAQKPRTRGREWLRQAYVRRALTTFDRQKRVFDTYNVGRKAWEDALDQHLSGLEDVLKRASTPTPSPTNYGGKGDLGDT